MSLLLLLVLLAAPAQRGDARTVARVSPATPKAVAAAAAVVQSDNIGVNGFFNVNRAQRGRAFQGAIVMEIPQGLHVNSNRPLGKYAVPTTVKVDAPDGMRVGAVSYPRAQVRSFAFSNGERLAVYEGRAIMRFNVTVPANFPQGVHDLRVRVRFQSCSDTVCYPPVTRTLTLPIGIVGATDPVQRINGRYFGGRG
ncbi:MAG TPA: protein-disulfide reductase DsbD N-terminal domain-containing protein [Pyrinomonadaceae bacterium]|nr:protein-disulfide reductase DsbD N-terminal domain-containing protein [Pyrinomonadaceae bacterium]